MQVTIYNKRNEVIANRHVVEKPGGIMLAFMEIDKAIRKGGYALASANHINCLVTDVKQLWGGVL